VCYFVKNMFNIKQFLQQSFGESNTKCKSWTTLEISNLASTTMTFKM
jgi:hypothetical protein